MISFQTLHAFVRARASAQVHLSEADSSNPHHSFADLLDDTPAQGSHAPLPQMNPVAHGIAVPLDKTISLAAAPAAHAPASAIMLPIDGVPPSRSIAALPQEIIAAAGALDAVEASTLPDGSRAVQLQHRLFAFSELGMFGRDGAQFAATARAAASTKQISQSKISQSLQRGAPVSVHLETGEDAKFPANNFVLQPAEADTTSPLSAPFVPRGAISEYAATPPTSEDGDKEVLVDSAIAVGEDAPLVINQVAMLEPQFSDGFEVAVSAESSGPGAMPPQILETRSQTPVNLVVSGSPEALAITVRSTGEPAEDMAKLRRTIENMVAEFGMDIAEFRINGSQIEQTSPMTGGNHGSRAR